MIRLISRFALVLVFLALLYLLVSGSLLSRSVIVLVAQVLAVGLSVWARRSFQPGQFNVNAEPKAGQLLWKGPYRFVRHPMYAAVLLLIWSGVLSHISPLNLLVALTATVVVGMRIAVEEQILHASLPGYGAYATATKRLIPYLL